MQAQESTGHTYTHTKRQNSIANEWLGGWEPLPASRKSPNHPKIMCQLCCKIITHLPWWQTAPLHSAHPSPSCLGSQTDGPNTRKWHGTATPLILVLGGWEICLPPSTENLPLLHLTLKKCNIPGLGCSESPLQKAWHADLETEIFEIGGTVYWVTDVLPISQKFHRQPKDYSETCYTGLRRSVYDPYSGLVQG